MRADFFSLDAPFESGHENERGWGGALLQGAKKSGRVDPAFHEAEKIPYGACGVALLACVREVRNHELGKCRM